jgi:plasmid stabilization system protein ParE
MVKKVVLSSTAKLKLEGLLAHLKQEWSEQVKQEFIEKLDTKISQVSQYPKSCPESRVFKGLYKCVVTKQTTFYYRIKEDEIEVATLFDTRQDPQKLNP